MRHHVPLFPQTHVARVLRQTGYDVIRASEVGQSRADDRQILKKAIIIVMDTM